MDGFLYKTCLPFDEINIARFTVTTWSFFPLACVGYDMVIVKFTPLHGWLSAISYPKRTYGIIVKYSCKIMDYIG